MRLGGFFFILYTKLEAGILKLVRRRRLWANCRKTLSQFYFILGQRWANIETTLGQQIAGFCCQAMILCTIKTPLNTSDKSRAHNAEFGLPFVAILPWLCKKRRGALFTHSATSAQRASTVWHLFRAKANSGIRRLIKWAVTAVCHRMADWIQRRSLLWGLTSVNSLALPPLAQISSYFILVQVTIYRRLLIARVGHLDQSEGYDIS